MVHNARYYNICIQRQQTPQSASPQLATFLRTCSPWKNASESLSKAIH